MFFNLERNTTAIKLCKFLKFFLKMNKILAMKMKILINQFLIYTCVIRDWGEVQRCAVNRFLIYNHEKKNVHLRYLTNVENLNSKRPVSIDVSRIPF